MPTFVLVLLQFVALTHYMQLICDILFRFGFEIEKDAFIKAVLVGILSLVLFQ